MKTHIVNSNSLQDLLTQSKTPEMEWLGIREMDETIHYHVVRDGKPEMNHHFRSHGAMVEVLYRGQFAYCCSPNLSRDSIRQAAAQALEVARAASQTPVVRFTEKERPAQTGHYTSAVGKAFTTSDVGTIVNHLVRASERLRSEKIVRTTASAHLIESRTRFVSSNGAKIEQDFSQVYLDYDATASHDGVTQTRSDNRGRVYQGGLEYLFDPDLDSRLDRVREEAIELTSAQECPTEKMDLVIAPDQLMLQIHESIGHPLEIDRILGDERNYAGWSFVKLSDFGTLQYGSKLMNVTFDPSIPEEFASYAYDDGGAPARKEFLIKEGLLLRGLGSLESQARSGIQGVANYRAASWNRAPIDRIVNINLEPGDSSFDQIISSVERGVLMRTNRSWSIDDFRNKFQFGCEYGQLIENGRLTKTVRNPNYRGVTTPFWKGLKMVGDRSTFEVFGSPYCGKGEPNQVIRVGHACPVSLFTAVEVFGGGK